MQGWVRVLCFLLLSAGGAAIWSALDRRRPSYVVLHGWLRVFVRYVLFATLIGYGLVKIIPTQFQTPPADWMLVSYGETSPMRLLWFFMGFSTPYTIFAGASEALGGLLLLARRTTTLGALVSAGVMTNVFMMNMSYDVPVKQYAGHLLLMALFLAAPDLRRLARFFVLNRATEPAVLGPPPFSRPWMRRTALGVKLVFAGSVLFMTLQHAWDGYHLYGAGAPKAPLAGAYDVESFTRAGVEVPPLLGDQSRWRWLVIHQRYVAVRTLDDKLQRFGVQLDESARTLALTQMNVKSVLSYEGPDEAGRLVLRGTFRDEEIVVTVKPHAPFAIQTRGFHWVTEIPFNR
jgi:hypothetical protein